MSIVSTMLIFVVHVVVGDIVVGRVKVEDIVYDIEPFSNYNHISFQLQNKLCLASLFMDGDKHLKSLAGLPPSFPQGQTSTRIQTHKPQVATVDHLHDLHTAQSAPYTVSHRHPSHHRIGRPTPFVSSPSPSQMINLDRRGQQD